MSSNRSAKKLYNKNKKLYKKDSKEDREDTLLEERSKIDNQAISNSLNIIRNYSSKKTEKELIEQGVKDFKSSKTYKSLHPSRQVTAVDRIKKAYKVVEEEGDKNLLLDEAKGTEEEIQITEYIPSIGELIEREMDSLHLAQEAGDIPDDDGNINILIDVLSSPQHLHHRAIMNSSISKKDIPADEQSIIVGTDIPDDDQNDNTEIPNDNPSHEGSIILDQRNLNEMLEDLSFKDLQNDVTHKASNISNISEITKLEKDLVKYWPTLIKSSWLGMQDLLLRSLPASSGIRDEIKFVTNFISDESFAAEEGRGVEDMIKFTILSNLIFSKCHILHVEQVGLDIHKLMSVTGTLSAHIDRASKMQDLTQQKMSEILKCINSIPPLLAKVDTVLRSTNAVDPIKKLTATVADLDAQIRLINDKLSNQSFEASKELFANKYPGFNNPRASVDKHVIIEEYDANFDVELVTAFGKIFDCAPSLSFIRQHFSGLYACIPRWIDEVKKESVNEVSDNALYVLFMIASRRIDPSDLELHKYKELISKIQHYKKIEGLGTYVASIVKQLPKLQKSTEKSNKLVYQISASPINASSARSTSSQNIFKMDLTNKKKTRDW